MRIRPAITVLASVASLIGLPLIAAAPAQASDASVRAAIKNSEKEVKESGELQAALKEIKDDPKTIAKLKKGLKEFETTLRTVDSKVEAQKASTATGKDGESDWTAGLRKVVKGFEDLGVALGDVTSSRESAGKTKLKEAKALVKAGTAEAKRGEALLGIKKS